MYTKFSSKVLLHDTVAKDLGVNLSHHKDFLSMLN